MAERKKVLGHVPSMRGRNPLVKLAGVPPPIPPEARKWTDAELDYLRWAASQSPSLRRRLRARPRLAALVWPKS